MLSIIFIIFLITVYILLGYLYLKSTLEFAKKEFSKLNPKKRFYAKIFLFALWPFAFIIGLILDVMKTIKE